MTRSHRLGSVYGLLDGVLGQRGSIAMRVGGEISSIFCNAQRIHDQDIYPVGADSGGGFSRGGDGSRHRNGGKYTRLPGPDRVDPHRNSRQTNPLLGDRCHLIFPSRTKGGHRLYSKRDVRLLQDIRRLVEEEDLSLQAVKVRLQARSAASESASP